jgi:hypothetical protein
MPFIANPNYHGYRKIRTIPTIYVQEL